MVQMYNDNDLYSVLQYCLYPANEGLWKLENIINEILWNLNTYSHFISRKIILERVIFYKTPHPGSNAYKQLFIISYTRLIWPRLGGIGLE